MQEYAGIAENLSLVETADGGIVGCAEVRILVADKAFIHDPVTGNIVQENRLKELSFLATYRGLTDLVKGLARTAEKLHALENRATFEPVAPPQDNSKQEAAA